MRNGSFTHLLSCTMSPYLQSVTVGRLFGRVPVVVTDRVKWVHQFPVQVHCVSEQVQVWKGAPCLLYHMTCVTQCTWSRVSLNHVSPSWFLVVPDHVSKSKSMTCWTLYVASSLSIVAECSTDTGVISPAALSHVPARHYYDDNLKYRVFQR